MTFDRLLHILDTILLRVVYRFVMIFIGIAGVFASIYFSYKWFESYIQVRSLAFLLAMANVGAINVLYSIKEELIAQKQYIKAMGFIVSWLLTLFISGFSTVETLYKGLYKYIDEYKQIEYERNSQKEVLLQIDEQIKNLEKDILLLEKKTNTTELKSWEITLLSKKRNQINLLLEEKKKLIQLGNTNNHVLRKDLSVQSVVINIYVLLSQILGGIFSPEQIQIFIYILPALFIDFVAPKMLYVALYIHSVFRYHDDEVKQTQQEVVTINRKKRIRKPDIKNNFGFNSPIISENDTLDPKARLLLKHGLDSIRSKILLILEKDKNGLISKNDAKKSFEKSWEYWGLRNLLRAVGAWEDIDDKSFTLTKPVDEILDDIHKMSSKGEQS